MLKNKLMKYLTLAFTFVVGLFMFGNSKEVSAANFENSQITYNEGDIFTGRKDNGNINLDYLLYIAEYSDYGQYVVYSADYTDSFYAQYFRTSYDPSFRIPGIEGIKGVLYEEGDSSQNYDNGSIDGNFFGYLIFNDYLQLYSKESGRFDNCTSSFKYYVNHISLVKHEEVLSEVDITSDNESAIADYIEENDMKTLSEYNEYGESQYNAGVASVDITSDNESVIEDYIEDHEMKTKAEYTAYGTSRFNAGVESVDITSDNESVIEDYIEDHEMKTKAEYTAYGTSMFNDGKKYNTFKSKIKRGWNNTCDLGTNVGKWIIKYVGFGWAWDNKDKFEPEF